MSGTNSEKLLEVYLNEYTSLKNEAVQRIRFRDNLLYVNLTVIGAIISYAATNKEAHYYALLLVPWICFILGWTYIVNDQKISAIGLYVRHELSDKINTLLGQKNESLFGWEIAHRSDEKRLERKILQLIVDEIAFCFSGLAAVGAFFTLVPTIPFFLKVIGGGEIILLLILGIEIFIYSDFKMGK